jgi:hypothetical protein
MKHGRGKTGKAKQAGSGRGRGKTPGGAPGRTRTKAGGGKTPKARGARAAGRKTAARKATKTATGRREAGAARPEKVFAETARKGGCACLLLAGEHVNGQWDLVENTVERPATIGGGRKGGRTGKSWDRVCQAMAALGHVSRARMLLKMLEGPATYRALQRVSALKAGPLYHHVNHLRLAGLILPKQRDLYELTRGGRNLMLVALGLAPLIRDKRRRPVE